LALLTADLLSPAFFSLPSNIFIHMLKLIAAPANTPTIVTAVSMAFSILDF
jgi:hypothetical protein